MKRPIQWVLKCLAVVAVMLAAVRLAVPVPLEGNWTGGMSDCLCGEGHQFTRFANGQAVFFHEGAAPKPSGTYRKTGWNEFLWERGVTSKPVRIRTGWLVNSYRVESDSQVYRDFRDLLLWKTSRMIRQSATED